MILPFSQQINGKPSYFVAKIWASGFDNSGLFKFDYENAYEEKFGQLWDGWYDTHLPKLHTIRADEKNRWKAGNKIHMVVFNRTKNQFRFAPVLECKGVQKIFIKYEYYRSLPAVIIDDKTVLINEDELTELAINDGFDSLSDFCEYFNQDFTGKIIHWTNLRY
jgi:hypothetical protein